MSLKELLINRGVFLFFLTLLIIAVFALGFALGILYDALLVSYVIDSLKEMTNTIISAGVVE